MIEKKLYTEEIHISNLLAILNSNEPICDCCPASIRFSQSNSHEVLWDNNACEICTKFVGLEDNFPYCPCIILGEEEALKITLLKLEEKGIEINPSEKKGD